MKYLKIFLIFFFIYFFSWFVLFKFEINSLPLQSEDVIPSIFTSIAIVNERTIYLDSYYGMMVGKYPQPDDPSLTPFYLRKVNENYVSAFPIMSSLVTLPIFLIYLPFVNTISWNDIYYLSHLSGSFMMACCVVLLYFFFKDVLKSSEKVSILVCIIYGLATINLPLISQALWQHGTVQFFTILSLIFWARERYFLTYLFLGFGILSRPTAGIVLLVLSLFILYTKKLNFKIVRDVFLGILIPLSFFIFYNFTYYQDISNQGYSSQLSNSWLGNFPESFVGMWLSPSKGILIYSPIFIFSLIGIYQGFKKNSLIRVSFWIILLHTLVLSKWKHWYGGFGFGYRMVSDIIPFFIIPIWYLLNEYYERIKKHLIPVLLISIAIQTSGLAFFDSIWHNAYDTGFKNTRWLWSIQDSEAAFNIRRLMVKIKILDKACDKCEGN
jgi:hypothetical protein